MKKDFTKLFLGLIIVVIGVSLLFAQLGLESIFGFSFSYLLSVLWPLIIVAVGLSIWFAGKNSAGLVISAIGLFFLLSAVFNIDVWALFWPVLLIIVGFLILFKGSFKPTIDKSTEEYISVNTVLSGTEKKVTAQNFKGGSVFAIFGGSDIDLRKCKISKDGATIEITAAFGGVKIYVPEDVQIVAEGTAFLGGWENKAGSSTTQNSPVLRITGIAVFGGVEIL